MNARAVASSSAHQKALALRGMQASLKARTTTGIDLKSPTCIYGMCEAHGVTVRFNDINMEGMYDRVPSPRIHLSALRPLVRRTFTCAHELGHHLFGHGSTIDELRDDASLGAGDRPDEMLANAFAAFVLMPTLGLREAFFRRKLDPNTAAASDIYSVACNFGVGQATLVNHLAFGVEMITPFRRAALARATPKSIRGKLLGENVSEPLIVADQHWNAPTLDAEEGMLLLLPRGAAVNTALLVPERELAAGTLFRAVKPGITRAAVGNTSWATYVRIARREYVGLARYRHLEDTTDD